MKKLLLIICIMFSITLNAQSEFYFGPKIGYKSNDYHFYHDNGNLTLGAYGRILFNNNINIQSELMYNYSSFTIFGYALPVPPIVTHKIRIHSFALPVYFGYQFINRDNFNMRANLGPVVHFNFDKCVEFMGREPDCSSNVELYFDYRFANLGAAFNIGADIYRFAIDLSYSLGLTDVFVGEYNYNRLNTFTFTVGYRFGK